MMMTKQEIFDFVADKLRKQGVRSMRGDLCGYRSEDGLCKCAIGHLIPDDKYNPEFDDPVLGTGLITLINRDSGFAEALLAGGVDGKKHLKLLRELQEAHDAWDDFDDWAEFYSLEANLQRVAAYNDLIYTPPKTDTEEQVNEV